MKLATAPVLAAFLLPLALLSGCASPSSGPQSVDVTWVEQLADEQSTSTVDLGDVTCEDLFKGEQIVSVEKAGYPEEPIFTATVIGEVHGVTVRLDSTYVFHSGEDFEIVDGNVTFSELPGVVSLEGGSERNIDAEATLSGTVTC